MTLLSRFFFLVLCSVASLQIALAQEWAELMQNPNVPLPEVEAAFEEYFKDRDKGRGTGWKQFKRWQYQMRFHTKVGGVRINPRLEWEEHLKFQETYPTKSDKAAGNWNSLGPTDWDATSGWNPGVGRITSIAINPDNNQEIYITSPGGGCWKSTDGGSTWSPKTDDLATLVMYGVCIDPQNTSTIYIATSGGGVQKSTNGGDTWSNTGSQIPASATTYKVLVHPSNSNIVFAANYWGLYRSTNGGTSWTEVIDARMEDIEFKPGDPSVVYASGRDFYKSTDGGENFTKITNGISHTDRTMIAVSPANPNYVYVVQADGSEFGYLYRSTDSGTSFSIRAQNNGSNTNYFGYEADGTGNGGQAWYDMAICVSNTNANEVHIGGIITWRSTDGGVNLVATAEWFYPNGTGYNHADIHALEYVDGVLYAGTDGGIYKSTNTGNTWTDLSAGLGIRQFYRIGVSKTNPDIVAGGSQDNGSSILKPSGWIDWLGADGMETIIDFTNPDIIYGTSQNGSLYKTTNGGASRLGISEPSGNGNWVTPWLMDPDNPTTLYLGYEEVHKTTNGASTWTAISSFGGRSITEMAIAQSNKQYLYVSKEMPDSWSPSRLYRTTDGGSTWQTLINDGSLGRINYIAVHPDNESVVAVATSTGVFKSTDAGANWTNITGNLPGITKRCVVFEAGTHEGLYVGLNVGIYYRDKDMANWDSFMAGLPNVQISELEIHEGSQKIRAATYGRGLWESFLYNVAQPDISLNNSSLDFEYVDVDASASLTINITNTGNAPLSISNITSSNAAFVPAWTSATINVGESRDLNISFNPTAAISYSASLIINSDAASGASTVSLAGIGAERSIALSEDLDFGSQVIGSSAHRTYQISNTGNAPFVIENISFPEGFSGDNFNNYSLPAGNTLNLSLFFSPTEARNYNGTLTVNVSNASGDNTLNVFGEGAMPTSLENGIEQTIRLYPNPVGRYLTLGFANALNGEVEASILNLQGQLIDTYSLKKEQFEQNFSFDLENLAVGQYILKIKHAKYQISKKFNKLK